MTERALTKDEEETAQATIEALRAQPYPDERAQRLSEKWVRAAITTPRETIDQIAVLWLRHILRIDEKIIERFVKNPADPEADEAIGKRHSAVPLDEVDHKTFWQEVAKLDSELVTEEELKTLSEHGHDMGFNLAHHLIYRLDLSSSSYLLNCVMRNAGANK